MLKIAERLGIEHRLYSLAETVLPSAATVEKLLAADRRISHVAMVHCETTTGILNPLAELAQVVKVAGRLLIVDAMSSFGGISMDAAELGIDYLISSANKCIQGVPGFAFVIARRAELLKCAGNARSLCLDLFDQWQVMDESGKWRYTSPTHTVRAFLQALDELDAEGGIVVREARYRMNQQLLVDGMVELGFTPLLAAQMQSPIITSFLYPDAGLPDAGLLGAGLPGAELPDAELSDTGLPSARLLGAESPDAGLSDTGLPSARLPGAEQPDARFDFQHFYQFVKQRGFVLYPGKISEADTFRIGNIGEVYPADIQRLLSVIAEY
jgi:aspartate aminotransferase-like enzyme